MIKYKLLVKKCFSTFTNIFYDPSNDYYKLLNLNENANNDEIKKSFFNLSMSVHPDKGGKEEDFKLLNKAYETLKSQEQRKIYDKLRCEFLKNENEKIEKTQKINYKTYHQENYYQAKYKYNQEREEKYKYYRNFNSYTNKQSYEYQNYYREEYNSNKYQEEELNRLNRFEEYYNKLREILKKEKKEEDKRYKFNITYIAPQNEVLYEDYKFSNKNKHYKENRIRDFEEKLKSNSKIQLNRFKIYNNMNEDEDYMKCLNNKLAEDEDLNSRLKIRDMKRLTISMTSIIITYLIFNIIYMK